MLKALNILEECKKLILNQTMIEDDFFDEAIKELKDIEHYAHFMSNCWVTDRPDLFEQQIKDELMWNTDFFKKKEFK